MAENNTNAGGLCTVLFIVFLILKLTNVIDWSWWWITAPLWGGFAIGLLVFIGVVLAVGIYETLSGK